MAAHADIHQQDNITDNPSMLHVKREWVGLSDGGDSTSFYVITYNILSDFFMDPVNGHNKNYSKELLLRPSRSQQLVKELEYHKDAHIVCLQEVDNDYFVDTLKPLMEKFGFHGDFLQDGEGRISGQATFFRQDRFVLIDLNLWTFDFLLQKAVKQLHPELSETDYGTVVNHIMSPSVLILTNLQCKLTGKLLTFCNMHGWYNDFKKMDVTVMQISTAIRELSESIGEDNQQAFFLCGDLNQFPYMPGYKVISNGVLTECEKEDLRKYPKVILNSDIQVSLIDIVPKCFVHDVSHFTSSYKEILGQESATCYCDDLKYVGALSYICYSAKTLRCQGVLDFVSEKVVETLKYCPNLVFPSDHVLLKAKFEFQ